jgi:hypothetical protein
VEIAANNTIPNYKVVGDFFVLWFQELFAYAKLFAVKPFSDAGRSFF